MTYVSLPGDFAGTRDRGTDRHSPLRARFDAWIRRRAAERAIRRRRAALQGVSDRTLRDIGIDRSELLSIASFGGGDASRRRRGAG